MSLVGKFFFCSGSQYLQSGEIIEAISPDVFLVKFDKQDGVPTGALSLFEVSSFLAELNTDGTLESCWEFFSTREELVTYLTWLRTSQTDSGESAEVVKLHS